MVVDGWCHNRPGKSIGAHVCVHYSGLMFGKSLFSSLVQESSSCIVAGVRYEGRYKIWLIFGGSCCTGTLLHACTLVLQML